jgi:hypothetical protein
LVLASDLVMLRKSRLVFVACVFAIPLGQHAFGADVPAEASSADQQTLVAPSAAARHMIEVVDAMDVERHWPAGVHVDWESGVPDGRPLIFSGKHTHCSAFVAAAAARLGVYILRPPDHAQTLLANAQYEWLAKEGAGRGWLPLTNALDAQNHANTGLLVVAVNRNHDPARPGHIAIVRPSDKSAAEVMDDGPQITQAGLRNYRSIALRQGFAGHPAAWDVAREVRFYAHAVDARR